jgi:hypothetical protein
MSALIVVKSDQRRQEFNPDKLRLSLQVACTKRPISAEIIERTVEQIESELRSRDAAEVSADRRSGMKAAPTDGSPHQVRLRSTAPLPTSRPSRRRAPRWSIERACHRANRPTGSRPGDPVRRRSRTIDSRLGIHPFDPNLSTGSIRRPFGRKFRSSATMAPTSTSSNPPTT